MREHTDIGRGLIIWHIGDLGLALPSDLDNVAS